MLQKKWIGMRIDGYDWKLTSKILNAINECDSLSGLATAFPSKTTDLLKDNIDLNLFDFYMIPLNSISYMMDINAFNSSQRQTFVDKVLSLNKKIIASRILAAGILKPKEAFTFLSNVDYVDAISIGVAKKEEASEDFKLLSDF